MGLRSALLEPSARWSRIFGSWFPRLSMRVDWNVRARLDAQKNIAGAQASSEASFWTSGKADLDDLILHGVDLELKARAVEIGCGLGRLLRPLSERIQEASGVDISTVMVESARQALADRPNARVFATSGRLDRFRDESVDFVYSYAVFQHVPSHKALRRYMGEAAQS